MLEGDRTKKILTLPVRPGTEISLSARGSTDPDGHAFTYEWFVYSEAGTYRGEVTLVEPHSERTRIGIPEAAGTSIHVILITRDHGTPRLASYRRVVLKVGRE